MCVNRLCFVLMALVLVGCSSRGYQRVNGRWAWVWYDGGGRQVQYLADAQGTLTVHSNENYATTSDAVYLWGVKLPKADPASFVLATYPYSKDAAGVYCGSVPITGADPTRFRVLGGLLDPMRVTSARAFERIVGPINAVPPDATIVAAQGWGADGEACYFGPNRLVAADPKSFVIMNDWYAKDSKQAYCGSRVIAGADVATFRITGPLNAADKNRQYTKSDFDQR